MENGYYSESEKETYGSSPSFWAFSCRFAQDLTKTFMSTERLYPYIIDVIFSIILNESRKSFS